MEQWQSSDAWVFAAILVADRGSGATLSQVIACADAINHAILLEVEFVRAVRRLIPAGLLEADAIQDHYSLTAAGNQLRSRWRGGAFSWSDAFLKALSKLGGVQPDDWSLPVGSFELSVDQYFRGVDRYLPKARQRKAPG